MLTPSNIQNTNGHNGAAAHPPKQVYWAFLPERCIYDKSFNAALRCAYRAGMMRASTPNLYKPFIIEYERTDTARQRLAMQFYAETSNPDDTLVMLDIDHDHPPDIISRLASHDVPIVVPLMFRRGEPHECCAFRRGADGELHHVVTKNLPPGLHEMHAVGTGAIAIQRRVFTALLEAGHKWFFNYTYFDDMRAPSEDLMFCEKVNALGIKMYLDATIETPHLVLNIIDRESHELYMLDNPEEMKAQVIPA